jgi:hypothetical protein
MARVRIGELPLSPLSSPTAMQAAVGHDTPKSALIALGLGVVCTFQAVPFQYSASVSSTARLFW